MVTGAGAPGAPVVTKDPILTQGKEREEHEAWQH